MTAAAGAPGAEGGDAVTDDDAIYDDDFCLTNGLTGEALTIPSANPKNFHQAISHTDAMPRQDLWAKLFLPEGPGPLPVVIIAPLTVGPHRPAAVPTGRSRRPTAHMHPQRLTLVVVDAEDLHVAQSHQQLAHARRVVLHRDPPDSAALTAPILGDPSRSAADPYGLHSDLIREEPLMSHPCEARGVIRPRIHSVRSSRDRFPEATWTTVLKASSTGERSRSSLLAFRN